MKKLYLIRHCKAAGQEPDAPLTAEGLNQAHHLSKALQDKEIERIVSSPFVRAIDSIKPLAEQLKLEINTDERLTERVLSNSNLTNWLDCLRDSFDDLDLCFEGGESNRTAMSRAILAIQEILQHSAKTTAVVTHGNLMTLILKYFDDKYGFAEWQTLSNPDVFCVTIAENTPQVDRIWR